MSSSRILFSFLIGIGISSSLAYAYLYFGPEEIVYIPTQFVEIIPPSDFNTAQIPHVVSDLATNTAPDELPLESSGLSEYIVVTDGCDVDFVGDCINVRAGPGTGFPVLYQLRNGVVLKIEGSVIAEGGRWYRIVFDEWIRYPERIKGDWYVHADYVEVLKDVGVEELRANASATTSKKIIVSRGEQKLYAYEDDNLVYEIPISTGIALTPTPRGVFTVFRKTPTRYMQGPLPNLVQQKYYDLPGVPWNLYFTEGGAVIHGAYWHNSFGSAYSHGCVNVPLEHARALYVWASLGTTVVVRD